MFDAAQSGNAPQRVAYISYTQALHATPPAMRLAIRICDIFISVVALIALLPALSFVALGVKLQDKGPILFRQTRLGERGTEFKCLKFRSMYVKADELLAQLLRTDAAAAAEWQADHKLRNDPRVTPFGKFLRKSSLDELPQLINVIKGEMSLVGPRPIIHAEIAKYGHSFRHYSSVTPGITGLWQVMGRNDVSYRRRVAMDRLFARRKSLKLYWHILLATVPAVLAQRGSY